MSRKVDYGINSSNGVLWIDGEAATNFGLEHPVALYSPADAKQLEGLQLLVQPPLSAPCHAVVDVKSGSLVGQILQQIPECRLFSRSLSRKIDAWLMNCAKESGGSEKLSIYFREQGLHHLWSGDWCYICGNTVLGSSSAFHAVLSPSAKSLRLALDTERSLEAEILQHIQTMARFPETVIPAFAFTLLCALRSEVMKRGGLSIFPLLSVVGPQNYGKTVLITRCCLLFDHISTGKPAAKLGSFSSESGLMAAAQNFRDQVVLIDDLGIGSHVSVERQGLKVMDKLLRFAANDNDRDTAGPNQSIRSQECRVGIAFTGEIPFTSGSDCSRILQIKLDRPLRGGAPTDRAAVVAAFYGWLEWFLPYADQQFRLLDQKLQEAPQVVHARLQDTYILLSWVLESFFRFALEKKYISDTVRSSAMKRSEEILLKLLERQAAYIEKKEPAQTRPLGNLAWYILEAYQKDEFHIVSSKKKLSDCDDCIVEKDCLCLRNETLLAYINRKTPYRSSERKLGTLLQEAGICPVFREKRSAGKRIKGGRYLELHLPTLKRVSEKY